MEKIKVIYKPNIEVVFDAPDGAYNDIVKLLLPSDHPNYVSSLDGSPYKFCLSLEDILFISIDKADKKDFDGTKVGF